MLLKIIKLNSLIACLLLHGCAVSYTDSKGHQHRFGLMDIQVTDESPVRVSTVTTYGVSFLSGELSSSFTLGYHKETLGYLENNECIQLNDLHN